MDNSDTNKARKYVLRLLSLRSRSNKEVEDRLRAKGFTSSVQKCILDLFRKKGLVDDYVFASGWVDSRLRNNPRGKALLKEELVVRGIPEDVIDKVFTDKASELDERSIANDLVRIKRKEFEGLGEEKSRARLYRFLVSRGIEQDLAEEVIGDVLGRE